MRHHSSFNRSILRTLVFLTFEGYFTFYCCSWILVRYTRKLQIPMPIVNNWLTDFVFVPLIAHISFVFGSVILKTHGSFKYPFYQILSVSLFTAIVFEGILPYYTNYNTVDFCDVLAYFAGGIFYYFVHQPYTSSKIKLIFIQKALSTRITIKTKKPNK